jgi:hypothetical protein
VGGVRDPGTNVQHGRFEINRAGVIAVPQTAQSIAKAPHIVFRQAAAIRQQDEAEKLSRCLGGNDDRLAEMQRQPAAGKKTGDTRAPLVRILGSSWKRAKSST